ncbi:hypothetical protein K2173_020956 [Erythroxylum novogranatense]|uniref:Uncharacterized protein n=1 Tax=Erythroxylum novogranatense TaxID=1862640 RepID=A0AAV8TNH3_9ROSI|nr:hypothetical protein K2173_020956 [Erythroxylum novogranatense]
MSLALIQGYSSSEEKEEESVLTDDLEDLDEQDDDDEEEERNNDVYNYTTSSVLLQRTSTVPPPPSSALPSALDAFSEISGPPQFLNNCVEEQQQQQSNATDGYRGRGGRWRNRNPDKKELPSGAVMESKAQLVGIRERVRSDVEANQPPMPRAPSTKNESQKLAPTVSNPSAEDAAELLRMCLQCGVPKTFSNARGMVCPVCGDRPRTDGSQESKKKGSTIKDKEKTKRMKGQSTHATWKSETEMQLRQQFD